MHPIHKDGKSKVLRNDYFDNTKYNFADAIHTCITFSSQFLLSCNFFICFSFFETFSIVNIMKTLLVCPKRFLANLCDTAVATQRSSII